MFYQSMFLTGFFAVWVVYNVLYVIYLTDILNHSKLERDRHNIGSYIVRVYLIALTNLFMAASMVILPIIALIVGIHVYWVVMGIIYTLVVHVFYIRMFIAGEVLGRKYKEEEIDKKKESNNLKVLSYVVMGVIIAYYVLIIFNSFEVLPLQKVILPPIMPLYYHMIVDVLVIGKVFLLNLILMYVYKLRLQTMVVDKNKGRE